ncbi:MAG: hypothetical protein HC796_09265 [Synechococcaceae cyanobacterium RL_1_2]|nr:hypothetical protein [Synechococcaceae cyanobacterium RL_1_2]
MLVLINSQKFHPPQNPGLITNKFFKMDDQDIGRRLISKLDSPAIADFDCCPC